MRARRADGAAAVVVGLTTLVAVIGASPARSAPPTGAAGQTAPSAAQGAGQSTSRDATGVKISVEKVGTVVLGDGPRRAVTVEATYDEDASARPEAWKRSLTRLGFRDGTGRLLYQETFETKLIAGEGFDGELGVASLVELRGTARRLILLTLGYEPSTPMGGTTLQAYGFDANGRFGRRGRSFNADGTRVLNPVDEAAHVVRLRDGTYLDLAEWTSRFTRILAWRFNGSYSDWEAASLCGKIEFEQREPGRGTVDLHRTLAPGARDIRELRLYKKVQVRPDSKVQFLEGCRRYVDTPTGTTSTPWLRVRVDGEEGWVINDQLDVLGLPAAD